MERVINRSDYRINNRSRKFNSKKKSSKGWLVVSIVLVFAGFVVAKIKVNNYENNTAKSELVSVIKNETNYVLEKFDTRKINTIENLAIPCFGTITSNFGFRESKNPIVSSNHMGIDIGAPSGTPIFASHDGVVTSAGMLGTYGNCVMIQNEDVVTVYAHCLKINVEKGDVVNQNDKIAEVGMTGNATGNHLHFEVRYKGEFLNPKDVIMWQ